MKVRPGLTGASSGSRSVRLGVQRPAAESGSAAPARRRRASVSAGQPAPSVRTAARTALQTPESGAPRSPFLDAAWLFEYGACRRDSALSKYSRFLWGAADTLHTVQIET